MSVIAERTARVSELIDTIKNHPMCGSFLDEGHCFLIIYPAGDFPVDGLQGRVLKAYGRALVLEQLLATMERHWRGSFPGFTPSDPC